MKAVTKIVGARILGGLIFASSIFYLVIPEIGGKATIGIILMLLGLYTVDKYGGRRAWLSDAIKEEKEREKEKASQE